MKNRAPRSESGNVLFIILIAVALLAALSYAVSQSTRSGGNAGTTEEKSRINGAYLHQFPTSIRQAIIRMKLSKSLAAENISFAHPSTNDYGIFGTTPENEVFNPQGGAVPYQSPPDQINDGTEWIFNGDIEINSIGTTDGTSNATDLLAILPGVSLDICKYLNFGVSDTLQTPPSITVAGEENKFTGTFGYAGTISNVALDGKDAYCYYSNNLGKYVYYQVLQER
ncbi:MAG: hypothetical protein KDJ26_04450 [Alphaproteobacteria bacterium]|nr:hypothetical protein [Alphaproteobacteria bacterium]MCB9985327.1 hypothetical protein [Micavibrio sp.]